MSGCTSPSMFLQPYGKAQGHCWGPSTLLPVESHPGFPFLTSWWEWSSLPLDSGSRPECLTQCPTKQAWHLFRQWQWHWRWNCQPVNATYVPFLARFSSHCALLIAKKKRSAAMQVKSKHTASVTVDTIQDDMATEQNIHGKGMFCISKLRSLSKSTDYFLML